MVTEEKFAGIQERTPKEVGADTPYPAGLCLAQAQLCPWGDLNVGPHHPDFVIFLVEIMQEKVAKRDKTLQLSPVADGQMPKSVLPHQQHTSLCFFLRAYG